MALGYPNRWMITRVTPMGWKPPYSITGLVNVYKKLWKIKIFNEKINYFYGHFQ